MELKKIHISDIGKVVTGKTPRTFVTGNYGGNIPFLTPSDDLSRKSAPKTAKTLTEQGLNEVKKCLLPPNSVCVSCIGSDLGKVVMTMEPTVTNQQFNSIIPSKDFNADFVYYLMTLVGRELNYLSKTSTAVPIINKSSFSNYEIEVPCLETQKKIASILSSIDSKIELNRRINENLEQQAQALFKSWFVDFEPFKDGKFVDSELGMIPEGWKVIETNKFMTISKESINPSKNPNCFYAHYSIPAFDEKSMPIFQYGNEIKSNKQKVSDNMTLVSKLNPRIKRIWFIDKACENAICSTEFIPYISLNNSPYFLYCYLDSDVFYNSIMSSVNGATGSHQRFQANDTLKFLFPYNEEVIYKFNLVVSGILKHKSRLIIESQKLSQLRDTLLPRLMSGKLEIKDNSYD